MPPLPRPPKKTCVCKDCGEEYPLIFMLEDTIWVTLADAKRDRLCLACTDARCQVKLGRRLEVLDFKNVKGNEQIFFGYDLSKREGE
jgi:hypothetical protein